MSDNKAWSCTLPLRVGKREPGLVYEFVRIIEVTFHWLPAYAIVFAFDSSLWFGITWQHQDQPAGFDNAMPSGVY